MNGNAHMEGTAKRSRLFKLARAFFVVAVVTATAANLAAYVCERFLFQPSAAPVRLVIIDKTTIPRAAFALSSIPLAVASYIKYGRLAFAMVPAVSSAVEAAFRDADFLVVGTHGINGGIALDDGRWMSPADVKPNTGLKHIYFGSCYLGELRDEWQAKYPTATIIGYDDATDPMTGWIYLVFRSWRDLAAI